MKTINYITCSFLVVCCAVTLRADINTRKILQAIEESNIRRVSSLVKKLDTSGMTPEEVRHLYGTLYDTAATFVDKKTDEIGYFGSALDVGQSLVGSLMTVVGVALVGDAYFKNPGGDASLWSDEDKELAHRCRNLKFRGAALGLLGSFIAYRGLTCSTQRGRLRPAQEVEEYLEKLYSGVGKQEKPTK